MERRSFIKHSIIISAGSLIVPSIVKGRMTASNVQLDIIGCGGRGTSVITSMSKNTNMNIIAMADIFPDRLKAQHPVYNALNAAKKAAGPEILNATLVIPIILIVAFTGLVIYMRGRKKVERLTPVGA